MKNDSEKFVYFSGEELCICLPEVVDKSLAGDLYRKFKSETASIAPTRIIIKSSDGFICQNAGKAFISLVKKYCCRKDILLDDEHLSCSVDDLVKDCPSEEVQEQTAHVFREFIVGFGKGFCGYLSSITDKVEYYGRVFASFAGLLKNPKTFRWADFFRIAESAAVNSFGICMLIGFLFGLILSFQSATSMKQFGAEIYVASLVSLTLFRVMGPFIAAILFSARSGTAFAAELGTMKINEEIDALKTFGLRPVPFLVLPRVLAGTLFVPVLTLYTSLFGLVGMSIVMRSMGYPFEVIFDQVTMLTGLSDFAQGMFKAIVYGFETAAIGCLSGLSTQTGSKAVGDAATKAVVSGVVAIVLTEGVFSVIFYVLGI
ncbi:putative phospholipid ABC transporter permease protein MlaE [Sedimentisphaera cyanobacteriorum]|uniref:Putative phospholipid ABC transporter permease protein MlaE n=1 Tax=Sedimentisphaera cyanobacteriorum TaxID=1940790 RepID=A0A1Q2HMV3_9BACT|nr:ABC transporter permease [Sedimentisphaera cyanobacteriorum]AQQ08621.1 putative phospholipid ABC transporter permease protein MlaE [Sedimentisphaera cyanobacteriorum]